MLCPKCGKPMVPWCGVPGCHAEVEQYSRIVGYMRPISAWNCGKQQEFEDRKTYLIAHGDHPEEQ